jgi:hypothetical protein
LRFYLAKSRTLLDSTSATPSSIQYNVVGASLVDLGIWAEALQYFRKSHELAVGDYERALTLRGYGRSFILAREIQEGIKKMEMSADYYRKLGGSSEYDSDFINWEVGDTFRRLTWTLIDIGDEAAAAQTVLKLEALELDFKSDRRADAMNEGVRALRARLGMEQITSAQPVASERAETFSATC